MEWIGVWSRYGQFIRTGVMMYTFGTENEDHACHHHHHHPHRHPHLVGSFSEIINDLAWLAMA